MTEPTPGATEPTPQPAAPAADPATPPVPADPAPTGTEGDDPAALKAEIAKLRRENASARVTAKQNAADEARQELAQTIGKALGLVQGDEPADPVKLTEQLTATQAAAKDAQVELAVFRAASDANGDPAALLDSRAFRVKVALLDPADTAAITAAITEAVSANPRLGVAQRAGMKPNPAQGASASPPLGLNERIATAEKAGDLKESLRLKSAQLLNTN